MCKESIIENQEQKVIEILKEITPAMEVDGGGVEFVSINEGIVYVRFKGACLVCPSIGMTLKHGVTKVLQSKLPWVKHVVNLSRKDKE